MDYGRPILRRAHEVVRLISVSLVSLERREMCAIGYNAGVSQRSQ